MELAADEDETYATRLLFGFFEGAEDGADEDGALDASELLLGVLDELEVTADEVGSAKALIDV